MTEKKFNCVVCRNCGVGHPTHIACDCVEYTSEFSKHFVPVIRAMRLPDNDWNPLKIQPSMNECLDILHKAIINYEGIMKVE